MIFFAWAAVILLAGFAGILWYCFSVGFYAPRKQPPEAYPLPKGRIYEPYYEQMLAWMKETDRHPCQEMEITTFDGLILRGRFYQYSDTAPVELMFPGYRGDARRDLSGGMQRCFALGHSALIVDQRACGRSEGHVISFGVNECKDCRAWVDLLIRTLGPDVKILLTGISMGAATVLLAAGTDLPPNVVGVLADCGYSSARAMIHKAIKEMGLPVPLAYPFVRLAGRLLGGFDVEQAEPVRAMQNCRVPVLFAHGDADSFVPCEMSRQNYDSCPAPKKLLIVPGAGHCLCYAVDNAAYIRQLHDFWTSVGIYDTPAAHT